MAIDEQANDRAIREWVLSELKRLQGMLVVWGEEAGDNDEWDEQAEARRLQVQDVLTALVAGLKMRIHEGRPTEGAPA